MAVCPASEEAWLVQLGVHFDFLYRCGGLEPLGVGKAFTASISLVQIIIILLVHDQGT